MKYSLFIMIIFATFITRVEAKTNHAPKALIAMAKKLASLRSISYQYYRELDYPQNNYFNKLTGSCYIDFNQTDKRTVSRFRIECDDYISIYNGTEFIELNKKQKTYEVRVQPKQNSFSSRSFFFNAIQTVRSEIQQWVESDSIPMYERDTLIENKIYKLVQLNMHQMLLYMGNTKRIPDSVTLYYRIIIDPVTWLPYQVLHTNNINASLNKTVFTNISTQPKEPETDSWYYTTYQKDYQPMKKEKGTPLIAAGAVMMPEWSLPEYNGKDDLFFKGSDLKGKLVMLDFWIKNCGHCMESFPVLQRLQKTYGGDQFQLVSINAHDKKEEIDFFYKREKPLYKMLYNGADLAKMLGVDSFGFPTIILLDKTGKVIYSGEFKYAKVEELIRANL